MKIIALAILFLAVCHFSHGQLDKQCNNDNDCGDNKMVCKQNICKCGVSYRAGNQKNCIHVAGSSCESNDECENLPGAICEANKCICLAGLLLGAKECTKIGKDGEECTTNSDCIHRISPPDDNKECKESKCTCRLNMHEGEDKRCKPTKMLRDICSAVDDCFQGDTNNNNALECKENACQCREGYTEIEDRCNGSATKSILSISTLFLILMTMLKI